MFLDIPSVLSRLLLTLCVCMIVTALIGAATDEIHAAVVFVTAAVGLAFFAVLNLLTFPSQSRALSIQSATFYTLTVSILFPVIAAVPFTAIDPTISFGDALFEAISALTTSGFTIFDNLNATLKTFLVWRSLLQWIGGFLIMTTMAAIVVQLTLRELPIYSSHAELREEYGLLERILVTARVLAPIYAILTLLCFLLLAISGVTVFNAFCIALSTLSTGGFLPADVETFQATRVPIQVILVPFMILGATNFMIHIQAISGSFGSYLKDQETLGFLSAISLTAVFLTAVALQDVTEILPKLASNLFATASLLSTTGYTIGIEDTLRDSPLPIMLFLMMVGGSMISTAGGIKIMRMIVLATHSLTELSRLTHPSSVAILKSGTNVFDRSLVAGIWITFVLTLSAIAMVSFALAEANMPFEDAIILAVTALSNTGAAAPALMSHTLTITDQSVVFKVALCTAMILGRIEILFLLPLFDRYFWKN